ncbi:related to Protein LST7 [Saccharomycodes ludwigii]|uniref:Related to Protein LST7 n=1 Tax=Saccharomycodes ludwigii TaxID=36035 RepID=A0A376B3F7_9ASCO|nr:hypothetical protein SCDLUD_000820 [Saccharomycodes ludwigii]KAH3903202.1 hypothetical protein SCDLUD_000820 [Saccharomycodes ludwigii]SSD59207.1 related to Protein LST7 [Saccharomycodes ludwigii]
MMHSLTEDISLNSFITLAHFCDKHGPKVIQITQVARNNNDMESLLLPDYPTDSYCDSCLIKFPEVKDKNVKLRSMKSKFESTGSDNHEDTHLYISTQYSATRFQLLSSIIKKIFSEETMLYNESPLCFYDNERGLNISLGFKLQDGHSRGNERRYCLIFSITNTSQKLCSDIMNRHWDFILTAFNKEVSYIKELRKKVIDKQLNENRDNPLISMGSYLRGNSLKIPKNLTELTGDRLFFMKLHKWNTYMLSNIC